MKLQQRIKLEEKHESHVMSAKQVRKFIQHFQRLTEQSLQTLPGKVNYLYRLGVFSG